VKEAFFTGDAIGRLRARSTRDVSHATRALRVKKRSSILCPLAETGGGILPSSCGGRSRGIRIQAVNKIFQTDLFVVDNEWEVFPLVTQIERAGVYAASWCNTPELMSV